MYWVVSDVNHGNAPLMATPPRVTLGNLGFFFLRVVRLAGLCLGMSLDGLGLTFLLARICLDYKKSGFEIGMKFEPIIGSMQTDIIFKGNHSFQGSRQQRRGVEEQSVEYTAAKGKLSCQLFPL